MSGELREAMGRLRAARRVVVSHNPTVEMGEQFDHDWDDEPILDNRVPMESDNHERTNNADR